MNNIEVDFSKQPAVAKCKICGTEVELLPTANVNETMKKIKEIEKAHETCGQ